MHFLKLISTFFKVNVQMSLAYRADTVVNILLNIMWLGWELLGLSIIFNNTTTLGGWGIGELIALLGVFRLINTMMASIIWPNTEKFNQSIRDGSLDYTLLQPAPSMFLVTFSRITIWRMWDLLLSIVLIVAGLGFLGVGLPPPQPEWGAMVAEGRALVFEAWWVSTLPGIMILWLSLGFNFVGDAMRDVVDPGVK